MMIYTHTHTHSHTHTHNNKPEYWRDMGGCHTCKLLFGVFKFKEKVGLEPLVQKGRFKWKKYTHLTRWPKTNKEKKKREIINEIILDKLLGVTDQTIIPVLLLYTGTAPSLSLWSLALVSYHLLLCFHL